MEAFLVKYNSRTKARLTIEMLDIEIDPEQFSDLASNSLLMWNSILRAWD